MRITCGTRRTTNVNDLSDIKISQECEECGQFVRRMSDCKDRHSHHWTCRKRIKQASAILDVTLLRTSVAICFENEEG